MSYTVICWQRKDDSYSNWSDPTNLIKQIVINLCQDKKEQIELKTRGALFI